MKLRERTRAYSLTMAALNLSAAGVFFYLSRLAVASLQQGLTVVATVIAVVGPLLTLLFVVVTIGWLVDSLRPSGLGDILPKIRPGTLSRKGAPEGNQDKEQDHSSDADPLLGRGGKRA